MSASACPRCTNTTIVKDGHTKGKQRWLCRGCSFRFTRLTPRGKSMRLKKLALQMYLEGLGFSAIARIVGVSDVAVLKWVRNTAALVQATRHETPPTVETMEFDEMWHYLKKKGASSGYGLLLIETPANLLPSSVVVVERQPAGNSGRK